MSMQQIADYFDVPRYYVYGAIAVVAFGVLAFFVLKGMFAQSIHETEIRVSSHFKEFGAYAAGVKLPPIRVAGPRGDIIDLRKTKGRYTVLNVWSTWCSPCIKELPALKRLDDKMKKYGNWRVIAVSIDHKDKAQRVTSFTHNLRVQSVANYLDYRAELQKRLNPTKLPMTLIVDDRGYLLYRIYGDADWDDPGIVDFLQNISR